MPFSDRIMDSVVRMELRAVRWLRISPVAFAHVNLCASRDGRRDMAIFHARKSQIFTHAKSQRRSAENCSLDVSNQQGPKPWQHESSENTDGSERKVGQELQGSVRLTIKLCPLTMINESNVIFLWKSYQKGNYDVAGRPDPSALSATARSQFPHLLAAALRNVFNCRRNGAFRARHVQ